LAPTGFTVEGKSVLACAPRYPGAKEEKWYLVLADVVANQVTGTNTVAR
jgi:hypothetical protein